MRVVAAYLLAVLGGKENPQKADIQKILASVNADASDEQIDLLLNELKGKNIEEVIAQGSQKLATVPVGGASSGSVSSGSATTGSAPAKKEKTPVPSSSSEGDMGLGLFG